MVGIGLLNDQQCTVSDIADSMLTEICKALETPPSTLETALESLIQIVAEHALKTALRPLVVLLPNFALIVLSARDPKLLPDTVVTTEPVVGTFEALAHLVARGAINIQDKDMLPI